ncbi:MAG: monovalent cation/H(+) antiporter subunit G [Trueperella sp.]|nr:monovalent cation/H(+) antiporter subunit G [Trueperella sp.]
MNWTLLADVLGTIAICIGAVFTLIAAIGMLRYQDLLSRQHVATKPQVFSLLCYFLGVALLVRESSMTWTLLLVIAFQLITAPISAHMISRTGYRTGRFNRSELLVDELGEDVVSGDNSA